MTRPPAPPGSSPGTSGGTGAFARIVGHRLTVDLLVVPGASRSRILGVHGDRVRVAVAEPPEGGRANGAVVALLAAALDVAATTVAVRRGDRQRRKTVEVTFPTPEAAAAALARLVTVVAPPA